MHDNAAAYSVWKPVILVVDDDPNNLAVVRDCLVEFNYTILVAEDGESAVQRADYARPDLILLDIMMPGTDGFETCRRLKSMTSTKDIPVIFMTALAETGQKVKGLKAGAVDYITKPFQREELLARIAVHMRISELTRSLLRSNECLEQRTLELEKTCRELKMAQNGLVQQEKMATAGQLAAGMAHEINNPIGFIISNLGSLHKYADRIIAFIGIMDAALEKLAAGSGGLREIMLELASQKKAVKLDHILKDLLALIDESTEGAARIKQLVQDLQTFSRDGRSKSVPTDVNSALENIVCVLGEDFGDRVTVVRESLDVPPISCNPPELKQALMNILLNAVQAIDGSGTVTIRSWSEGRHVCISIADNGIGMPEEMLDHIFEPFFTTREVGGGVGLGLSIAYDIINRHHGEIVAESEPGKGSVFIVKLPEAGQPVPT